MSRFYKTPEGVRLDLTAEEAKAYEKLTKTSLTEVEEEKVVLEGDKEGEGDKKPRVRTLEEEKKK